MSSGQNFEYNTKMFSPNKERNIGLKTNLNVIWISNLHHMRNRSIQTHHHVRIESFSLSSHKLTHRSSWIANRELLFLGELENVEEIASK
jgi:hypothetical protein